MQDRTIYEDSVFAKVGELEGIYYQPGYIGMVYSWILLTLGLERLWYDGGERVQHLLLTL